ncbi:hypothetical protein B479_10205 [Pseudomonas putida HB3267]|nr:hypothetical protein B479_10205 [Pseudomonas putida HB3267]
MFSPRLGEVAVITAVEPLSINRINVTAWADAQKPVFENALLGALYHRYQRSEQIWGGCDQAGIGF